jgi:hypothetical protein
MFIPESFHPLERPKIRDCFFGQGDVSVRVAVITPLEFMFKALGENLMAGEGWWKTRYGGHVLVTHAPQGAAVTDAISALEPGAMITMVGIAGSVSDLKVGDIVEAGSGLFPSNGSIYARSYPGEFVYKSVRMASVESLAQSRQTRYELALTVDCVDMETAPVYATALRQGHFARSIQVISDDSSGLPFFAAGLDGIEPSVQRMLGFIEQYIEDAAAECHRL